ncbi:electron transfer flavoprotein subunit beta/FixA family protein [Myxococcota bacterium]|nr:electron transfer flavoprotein subunit beta/FixA family protein [Myxococcota bacterium]
MKIGVLLKQVPSTDTQVKIADPSAGISTADVKWTINPYDEFAIEEALRLKEAGKATEVLLLTVGNKDVEQRLRDALAMGADRAMRLDDPGFVGSDPLGVARILAAAAKAEGVQLVLGGKQAADDDNGQVPIMVAELLGWAHVGVVTKLEIAGETFKAWRASGGGAQDVVEGALPAVITADKGLNEPRYASLKNIMMAKKKAIEVKGMADLGLSAGQVGAAAALVKESGWSLPPQRPAGRILQGDNAARVKELVAVLRDEAKVI